MHKQAGIAEIVILIAITIVATYVNMQRLHHNSDQLGQDIAAAKVDRLEREITELKAEKR